MKVTNMINPVTGKKVANQYVVTSNHIGFTRKTFQSYESIVANIDQGKGKPYIELDKTYYNYSKTTTKYLCQFLGVTNKQLKEKIKSGEYILTDLN